jgi:hypothetical protein
MATTSNLFNDKELAMNRFNDLMRDAEHRIRIVRESKPALKSLARIKAERFAKLAK